MKNDELSNMEKMIGSFLKDEYNLTDIELNIKINKFKGKTLADENRFKSDILQPEDFDSL